MHLSDGRDLKGFFSEEKNNIKMLIPAFELDGKNELEMQVYGDKLGNSITEKLQSYHRMYHENN